MPINRILIVGLGSIGQRHLRLARGLFPKADIRVLRHQAGSTVPDASNGSFSHLDEAIDYAPQIAIIASPATFHIATAQALAESGVHLFIEKPLSASLDGVAKLLLTCKRHRTVLMIGYNLRFLPSLQIFRNMLGKGVVGKVLSVRCEIGQYLPSWRSSADYRQGVSARQELGGGALLELSHELDYLQWIFGEVEWVKASLSRQSDLEINVEDTAHLIVGFASKVKNGQLVGTINLDFIRHDTTRLCTVIGEKGSLRWNGLTGAVEMFEAGAKEWSELFRYQHQSDDSYLAEWRNFIDCVREHKLPLVTGEDGLRVLHLIEATRKSAESGCNTQV